MGKKSKKKDEKSKNKKRGKAFLSPNPNSRPQIPNSHLEFLYSPQLLPPDFLLQLEEQIKANF